MEHEGTEAAEIRFSSLMPCRVLPLCVRYCRRSSWSFSIPFRDCHRHIKVEHHTGAHGQRYQADTSKAKILRSLLKDGSARIASWAMNNDHDEAAAQILNDKLDGRSAKRLAARDIA